MDQSEISPISSTSVQHMALKLTWDKLNLNNQRRNDRLKLTRQMLAGELRTEIPEEFEIKNRENYRVRLPQGTTVPLKTVNVLQRKLPKLRRNAIGVGPGPAARASKLENWSGAVMDNIFDWDTTIDWMFNEAEVCAAVTPMDAHWEIVPTFEEVLEELVPDPNEHQEDPKRARTQKVYATTSRIRPMYLRDDKGRAKNDPYYKRNKKAEFKPSVQSSSDAYDEILTDHRARNLPWQVRIINASDVYPIFGANRKLEGVIIKQQYKRNQLIKRNLIWDDMDVLLQPSPDGFNTIPDLTLYEYIGYDENGDPIMAYSVDGKTTQFQKGAANTPEDPLRQADAKINLREEYGLTRLPVSYTYGWHYATRDPQDSGVPFIWPFIPSLLGADALATATVLHSWWTAFGGWFSSPDPKMDPRAWMENGKMIQPRIKPMSVTIVPGPVTPAVHSGVGQDVYKMISMMMGAVEQEMPGASGGAFGASGATSGHDRSLMRDYLEDSVSQVLKGASSMYSYVASILLEYACHMADKFDMGIPVYRNVEVGPKYGGRSLRSGKPITEMLTLDPGDVGINYDLEAYYPHMPGENPVLTQQLAEMVKQKLATFEEYRLYAFGDESPEETRIIIAVDEMIFETDIGRNYIYQLAFEYLGEDRQQEMAKLIEQNLMTKDGMPTALIQGVFPSSPSGGAPSGSTAPGGGNPGNVMSGMGGQGSLQVPSTVKAMGGVMSGAGEYASTSRDAASRAQMLGAGNG